MILSHDNSKIKLTRKLLEKKHRTKMNLYIAEGDVLVNEYIQADAPIEFILYSEHYKGVTDRNRRFQTFAVKKELFNQLSDTINSQGVLAVVRQSFFKKEDISKSQLILYIDGVQDPGNLGTIIRSCDAFGVESLIINNGCVDMYNPKVVRATMGSLNRIRHIRVDNDMEMLEYLKDLGYKVFSTTPDAGRYLHELADMGKSVLVIGNESKGIQPSIKQLSDMRIKIRMNGKAESLNAGVAASICLYHITNINNNRNRSS